MDKYHRKDFADGLKNYPDSKLPMAGIELNEYLEAQKLDR
jgi:hypothetical protein